MLQVFVLVFPLFSLVALGFLSGKFKKIPLEGLAWINFFLVYIALPALFFQLLSKTPVAEFANFTFLAASTFGTLVIFALSFFVAGFFNRGDVPESTIQGFAGAYGNIGYMGPPLAIAAFGPEAGVPVALVFCLDNSMHFAFAPLLMALNGKSKEKASTIIFGILWKIFSHPFIIATIVAIAAAFMEYQPPKAIGDMIVLLSQAAAPVALFAMGVTAALRPVKRIPFELSYLLPIKLILHPLLVWWLLAITGTYEPIWVYSAVLLACLPTATNVFVIAQQYSVWQERASAMVVVSTAVSVVTVTGYLYIVKQGII